MKVKEDGLDFKFLNKVVYVAAFIGLYFFLKNIGIMDKIMKGLVALTPIYIGIIICWITMPLVRFLRRLGIGKNIAAVLSLVLIFGLVALIFSLTLPIFAGQLSKLLVELPNIYTNIINWVNDILQNKLHFENGIDIASSLKSLDITKNTLENILDYSINTIQSVFAVVISFFTAIIVSFFMAKDMEKFKDGVIGFLCRNSKDDRKRKMITEIDATCMSYIKGTVIDSFIVGVLTTLVCLVLKLDYAVVFGMVVMLLNFIPYLGAILSYLVVSLYALATGGPVFAIITFISLLIVQIIDANILQPNIIAKSVNLHPVVVIGGLIVFQLFFNIPGMVIAMPVLAGIKVYIKYKFNLEDEEEIDDKKTKIKKELKKAKA